MELRTVPDGEKLSYLELLLLADEQQSMIERYLYRGTLYALYDGGLRSICVVTQEPDGVLELKNVATLPAYQRMGYGKALLSMVAERCKGAGRWLSVGTGDSPSTIGFYEACGFRRSHVVKEFFTQNYDHPIYEDGRQLVDMVYLKQAL